MRTLERIGATLYGLSLVAIIVFCPVMGYILRDSTDSTLPTSHTSTSHPRYYMAHCDNSGHYRLVTTTSDTVATDEQALGYWPIPSDYYAQLSGSLDTLTCVPGPMDKGK